jgi:uncharacterized protein YkuJ
MSRAEWLNQRDGALEMQRSFAEDGNDKMVRFFQTKIDQLGPEPPVMTIRERLKTVPAGSHLLFIRNRIEYMMTGATEVGIENNEVCVAYENGLIERRPVNDTILEMDADTVSIIALVSFVQDGREQTQQA